MITTCKDTRTTTTTTTEEGIAEEQKKQYQDIKQETSRRMFNVGNVNNTYIENKYIRVSIDPLSSKVAAVTLSNGVHVELDIQFYFYASDDPVALGKTGFKKPGAYLFRAMENTAIPVLDFIDVQVFKTEVVQEAHLVYSDWTSFVIRVYDESPVIEVEWLVGPVPVADKLGKEVFIRYLTNLVHDGVFYTDSNGRQNIKRIRNLRPQFEPLNIDQVAGNYYPVTSRISIQDLSSRVCFSVFTDRAQGGTSLSDGEIDLMVHRRILTDDTGVGTFVNDTEWGKGVAVRGKHYLYISKIDHKPYRIFEKKFAKEVLMGPQVLISRPDPYGGGTEAKHVWSKSVNELSFLKTKLPIGVHILTVEHWNDETLLLRLENYLEKSDARRNHVKTVFLRQLFTNIVINSVKETTLGANMWLKDYKPRKWNKKENFVKSFNEFYGVDKEAEFLKDEELDKPATEVDLDEGITLAPQQIRTLVCSFDYVDV
ncbi:lysosomal alpha-mannosidase [Phthorimaea operculella]|nr:lysosomal alpha-mannosidase [Phthorimaea operculella]